MSKQISFELVQNYVELISYIEDINSTERRSMSGVIKPHNRTRAQDLLTSLTDNPHLQGDLFPDFDVEDGEISINFPSFYYKSLNVLIEERPELRSKLPNQIIYFSDEDCIFDPTQIPNTNTCSTINNYLDCIALYGLLKSKADHVSQTVFNEETLFFLGKKKLEITNDLNVNNSIQIKKLKTFKTNFFDTNIHKDAIKQIISDSLFSYFPNKNQISINNIIRDFDNIFDVINNNYSMYLSEFTFEKVKKEVEKFRTESITRINKAFSDIQMQIIAVPASLIVVANSLKTGKDFSIAVNSIVLLGALFFAISVLFMCENQKDTLKNIKHEIDAQEKIFLSDPLFKNEGEIIGNFKVLRDRYQKQGSNILKIRYAVFFSILLMFFMYFYYLYTNSCISVNIPFLDKVLTYFYCK